MGLFGRGGFLDVCAEDDVGGGRKLGQLRCGVLRVEQIDSDGADSGGNGGAAAGQAVDFGIRYSGPVFGSGASADSVDTGNDDDFLGGQDELSCPYDCVAGEARGTRSVP